MREMKLNEKKKKKSRTGYRKKKIVKGARMREKGREKRVKGA